MIPAAKPVIGDDERSAVDRVLRSGMVAQGPEVARFEEEFSEKLVGGRSCVAVSSGTTGLHLGLIAAGIGPGDEVIVPSFTFAATANAVALAGATPVFADIDAGTFNITARSVREVISSRTAALMPVHLYGQAADMTALSDVAREYGIQLFEDAAQAHAATWDGQQVGSFGTFGMFSLYPTKNMTAGEGGMVACTPPVARKIRLLRNQGMERRYSNEVVGFNARMTDIHAAIGRVQLGKLPEWTLRRQRNAAFFNGNLENVDLPVVAPEASHVYHQYTIRVAEDRDGFAKALADEYGIGTGVYYPTPTHRLPSFNVPIDLPETGRAAREVLSLPIYPALTKRQLESIAESVNKVARAGC